MLFNINLGIRGPRNVLFHKIGHKGSMFYCNVLFNINLGTRPNGSTQCVIQQKFEHKGCT